MKDALLVIDVISEFDHDDGHELLASFRRRLPALRAALAGAREAGVPVIYVNDFHGRWNGDVAALVRDAIAGPGGDVAAPLAPAPRDPFLLEMRYSAFDHTPLDLLLEQLAVGRLLLVGATTEGCIVQTGIDAREHGFRATILAPACTTIDPDLERVALTYAEEVAGIRVASAVEAELDGQRVRS